MSGVVTSMLFPGQYLPVKRLSQMMVGAAGVATGVFGISSSAGGSIISFSATHALKAACEGIPGDPVPTSDRTDAAGPETPQVPVHSTSMTRSLVQSMPEPVTSSDCTGT